MLFLPAILNRQKNTLFRGEKKYQAVKTLRTGDADLRLYITTVQDG